MSTNPMMVLGRSSGFQAPASSGSFASSDALGRLARDMSALLMDVHPPTSSRLNVRRSEAPHPPSMGVAAGAASASAATVLARLQERSGLTLDELADVLGTSRRTLHNWKNGGVVHAGNDRRLREIDHAVERMSQASIGPARDLLRSRRDGGVRPMDLLAEGRFDAAVAMVVGTVSTPVSGENLDPALAARLDPVGHIEPVGPVIVLRRSGRRRQT